MNKFYLTEAERLQIDFLIHLGHSQGQHIENPGEKGTALLFPSLIGVKGWNSVKRQQVHLCKRHCEVFAHQTHRLLGARLNRG